MSRSHAKRAAMRAFTLMELLISSLILIMMLMAVLSIFDQSARIARDQSELAVMQQSLRVGHQEIVRFVRQAGLGGLPLTWADLSEADVGETGAFPNGFAVAIENNVPDGTQIGNTYVLPGSDVLTLRGVFTTPVYYIKGARIDIASKKWVSDAGLVDEVEVEIPSLMGHGDYLQSLDPLIQRLQQTIDSPNPNKNLAFILRDLTQPDQYAVLEWNSASGKNKLVPEVCGFDASRGMCITVALRLNNDSGAHFGAYGELMLGTGAYRAGGSKKVVLPAGSAAADVPFPNFYNSIGLLEEYRFYLRADWEIPNDQTSRLMPVLTREQFLPNTDESLDRVDLVDGLVEFQLAVGFDRDWESAAAGHNVVTEGDPWNEDEVLFNDVGDYQGNLAETALTGGRFRPRKFPDRRAWFHPDLNVHFLRITTVAQATKPTPNTSPPRLGTIEDFNRALPFTIESRTYDLNEDTKYRRRVLRTIVDLRNLK